MTRAWVGSGKTEAVVWLLMNFAVVVKYSGEAEQSAQIVLIRVHSGHSLLFQGFLFFVF